MADLAPQDWHWLDLALVAGLLVIGLNAARRGFIREVATLAGLAGGVLLAGRAARPLADLLAQHVERPPFAEELAYVAVVVLVVIGANTIASALSPALRLPGLPVADRVAGLALGLAEGAAGLGLALLLATRIGLIASGTHALDGSTLAPLLLRWWLTVAAALPPALRVPGALTL